MCWALRLVFDSLDGINTMSDDFSELVPDIERMAELTPQMAALMPAMIQTMKNQKQIMLNQYQAQKMQQDQNMAMQEDGTAMGEAFDAARNDDTFYLPPEAFETADFQRGMKLMMSPDGSSTIHRFPPGRSTDRGRHGAYRSVAYRGVRRHQGHPTGGIHRLCRR